MDPITKEILKNMVELDENGDVIDVEPKKYYTGDASIDFALNNACVDSIEELLDIFELCIVSHIEDRLDENWYGSELWADRRDEVRQCIVDVVEKTDISIS